MQQQQQQSPFQIKALAQLTHTDVARVVKTCETFTRALKEPHALVDQRTLERFVTEARALYDELWTGRSRLSPDAVERFGRWPGQGGERLARRQLRCVLESAFEAVANHLGQVSAA